MKFTCSREDLSSAINVVSRVVPQRHANYALTGILVHAGLGLQLTGYNLETGITMNIPGQIQDIGRCIMPCPLFGEIVRKLPFGEDVTVEMDEECNVTITCGITRFQIKAADAIDYPELPQIYQNTGSLTLAQNQLKRLIEGTSFCVSTDQANPVHTGCLMEIEENTVSMVALDGYRIAVRREKLEQSGEPAKFVVNSGGLKEVQKLLKDSEDPISFIYDDKRIIFDFGDTNVICRLLAGSYLDYRRAITRYEDLKICVGTRALENSVERVRLMTTDTIKNPIRCTFLDGQVELQTKTPLGTARDVCSYAGDGKELTIGFNCQYFQEALKAIEDSEVILELHTSLTPMLMLPADPAEDKFLYMVLPVRI